MKSPQKQMRWKPNNNAPSSPSSFLFLISLNSSKWLLSPAPKRKGGRVGKHNMDPKWDRSGPFLPPPSHGEWGTQPKSVGTSSRRFEQPEEIHCVAAKKVASHDIHLGWSKKYRGPTRLKDGLGLQTTLIALRLVLMYQRKPSLALLHFILFYLFYFMFPVFPFKRKSWANEQSPKKIEKQV